MPCYYEQEVLHVASELIVSDSLRQSDFQYRWNCKTILYRNFDSIFDMNKYEIHTILKIQYTKVSIYWNFRYGIHIIGKIRYIVPNQPYLSGMSSRARIFLFNHIRELEVNMKVSLLLLLMFSFPSQNKIHLSLILMFSLVGPFTWFLMSLVTTLKQCFINHTRLTNSTRNWLVKHY